MGGINWKDEFYGASFVTRDRFRNPAIKHGGVVVFWESRFRDLKPRLDGMSVAELTAWEMLADVHKQITSPNTHPRGQWVRQQLQRFCSEVRTRRRRKAIKMAREFNQAGADTSAQVEAVSNLFALAFPLLCRRWIPTNFYDIAHPAWHSQELLDYAVPARGLDAAETCSLTEALRSSAASNRLDTLFDEIVAVATHQLEAANVSLVQTVINHTRRFIEAAVREGRNGAGSWCKTWYPYVTGNNVDGAVILDVIVSVRPYEMLDQGAALNTWTDVEMDDEFRRAVRDDAALAAFEIAGKEVRKFETAIYLDDFPGGITYPSNGTRNGNFQLKDGSGWLASALALGHGAMGAMSGTPLEEDECSSIVATGVSIRRSTGATVGNVNHMKEKSMAAALWESDLYVPMMAVSEAQKGQQAVAEAGGTARLGVRGVRNFSDALKSWNPPEPQAWSRPSIWWELLVTGLSVSAVVALVSGIRLDIADAGRLLLATSGFSLLLWSALLVIKRWVRLRDARKFKPRRFEDITSLVYVAMSFATAGAVSLTLYETIHDWVVDALNFEILIVQLAATILMVVARRT